MELTTEEVVTRLLVSREILQVRQDFNGFNAQENDYNLGDFIEKSKLTSTNNMKNGKYIFIGA